VTILLKKRLEKVIFCYLKPLGAFGYVHKAIHKTTKDTRAIKFINKDLVTTEQGKQLMQEIEILKQLVIWFQ
jgi:serine/threonine protein kinase